MTTLLESLLKLTLIEVGLVPLCPIEIVAMNNDEHGESLGLLSRHFTHCNLANYSPGPEQENLVSYTVYTITGIYGTNPGVQFLLDKKTTRPYS